MLEEVPDVTYDDVGGLDDQIEQITDAVELPFLHAELFPEHELPAAEGHPALRPARAAARRSSPRRSPTRWPRRWPRRPATPTARCYFLNIKGPELLNKYVGETERQIRLIFQRAREKSEEGCAGHRVLRRDGLAVPHPRHRHLAPTSSRTIVPQLLAEIDGVESAEERDRDRRVEPRGPHRPGDPAPGPPRREDQDRAPRTRRRRRRSSPATSRPTCPLDEDEVADARRRRRRQGRAGDDRAHRRRDVPRRRATTVPRGHLPERRQGDPVLQGLLVGRHDREHRAAGEEARDQAPDRRAAPRASAPRTSLDVDPARSTRSTRTCPTRPTPTTGRRSRARRASASSTCARSSTEGDGSAAGGRPIERVATGQYL